MQIKGTTRVCGLIGNPVAHSLSPFIHNKLAQGMGIDLAYVTFKVEGDKVSQAVNGAYALDIMGMNVTVPHKQAVMDPIVEIDPLANAIGAVNTLVRVDGGYKGYNTDILGLKRELKEAGVDLKNRDVVILGAGGAARAIAFLCASEEARRIDICNRTVEKAKSIEEAVKTYYKTDYNRDIDIRSKQIENYTFDGPDGYLVIQATSIGLAPNVDDVVIEDPKFYERAEVGVDIIYNPAETKFMKLMKMHGAQACNGLMMLLYQAVAAFELWNDCQVDSKVIDSVRNELIDEMKKPNIVLIGFMGSGKSSLGRWIAKNHDYELIDTDEAIEKKEGRSISDIFETDGEDYFRNLETELIKELSSKKGKIISVGGGLPVKEENQTYLKQAGKVVYLKASLEELVKRLSGDDKRPLLKGSDLKTKIESLMEKRKDIYSSVSDIEIDTTGREFEDLYEEIINN